MSESKYFIHPGYRENLPGDAAERPSLEEFWTPQRIRSAEYYQYPVYQYANTLIQAKGITSVADVGCGVAKKLSFLRQENPNLDIVGLDQKSAIEYCRKTYDFGRWYVADLDKGSLLEDLKSDLVICSDVIEHMTDPDVLLETLKKMVSPNGWILLSTPERDRLRGKDCLNCPHVSHVREWSFSELNCYLRSRGFFISEQFLQYPVKFGFSRIWYHEIVKRALKLKPLKYNQVCLLRIG